MNKLDLIRLEFYIKNQLDFMIGRPGTSIKFHWSGFKWFGEEKRSHITLCFSRLVLRETTLSGETPGWCPLKVDLTQYTKVTRINQDMIP